MRPQTRSRSRSSRGSSHWYSLWQTGHRRLATTLTDPGRIPGRRYRRPVDIVTRLRNLRTDPLHAGCNRKRTSMKPCPLSNVTLLESPFSRAVRTDLAYVLSLNPDRLLAPFLREAGLEPRAANYGNWERSDIAGHIGGHYLSALALLAAATGEAEPRRRLDYMVAELARAQYALGTGYIGGIPGGAALFETLRGGGVEAARSFGRPLGALVQPAQDLRRPHRRTPAPRPRAGARSGRPFRRLVARRRGDARRRGIRGDARHRVRRHERGVRRPGRDHRAPRVRRHGDALLPPRDPGPAAGAPRRTDRPPRQHPDPQGRRVRGHRRRPRRRRTCWRRPGSSGARSSSTARSPSAATASASTSTPAATSRR